MYLDMNLIKNIDKWLDDNVSEGYKAYPLGQDWARISKVIEELGESISKFIGYTGQNPRKGYTNDLDDVLEELADTAFTAILAMQHFTKDHKNTASILESKLQFIANRIGINNGESASRT